MLLHASNNSQTSLNITDSHVLRSANNPHEKFHTDAEYNSNYDDSVTFWLF